MIYVISEDVAPVVFVKFGYSRTVEGVEARRYDLQTGNPRPLRTLAIFPGGFDVERGLHAEYGNLRAEGEWFRVDERLARFLAVIAPAHPHGHTVDERFDPLTDEERILRALADENAEHTIRGQERIEMARLGLSKPTPEVFRP